MDLDARVDRWRSYSRSPKIVKEPQEVRSWIVCDGDVDPNGLNLSTLF